MFRYRLAYLLLIGFGVFFYIAFVGYFSYYFLLLILILPVLSLFYLVMSFKFTKLDFAILNQKVIQDDFVKIKTGNKANLDIARALTEKDSSIKVQSVNKEKETIK